MPFNSLAEALQTKGSHHDSLNLYLDVRQPGKSASWLLIYEYRGKRCELGLGSPLGLRGPKIGRQQARRKAAGLLTLLANGLDPKVERQRQRQMGKPFSEVATAKIALLAKDWKNPAKMTTSWTNSMKTHAARLWAKPVSEISDEDVIDALRPIWTEKPAMAECVRARIETVLDYGVSINSRAHGPNPSRIGYVTDRLGSQPDNEKSRAAMPLADVPGVYARIRAEGDIRAKALAATALTCLRGNETRHMKWAELDLDKGRWTIPPIKMKGSLAKARRRERDGQPHVVILSDEMLAVLKSIKPTDSPYVFVEDGKLISHGAIRNRLRDFVPARVGTQHGFRTNLFSFVKQFPKAHQDENLVHWALDHAPRTDANADLDKAYNKGAPIERCGALWARWSDFVSGKFGEVVQLRA